MGEKKWMYDCWHYSTWGNKDNCKKNLFTSCKDSEELPLTEEESSNKDKSGKRCKEMCLKTETCTGVYLKCVDANTCAKYQCWMTSFQEVATIIVPNFDTYDEMYKYDKTKGRREQTKPEKMVIPEPLGIWYKSNELDDISILSKMKITQN